jgi:putative Mg2+ transporter-C (MgtC) family protein
MAWTDALDASHTIVHEAEALARLLLAASTGAVIGVEREIKDRPAGLRTNMLVALAAALFTILTLELHHTYKAQGADPIRIIEAVTAGVAFLAAGAIIQSRRGVYGLTTGAAMWVAGALGVAAGAGYYALALMSTVLAFVILAVLNRIELGSTPKGQLPAAAREEDRKRGEQDNQRS